MAISAFVDPSRIRRSINHARFTASVSINAILVFLFCIAVNRMGQGSGGMWINGGMRTFNIQYPTFNIQRERRRAGTGTITFLPHFPDLMESSHPQHACPANTFATKSWSGLVWSGYDDPIAFAEGEKTRSCFLPFLCLLACLLAYPSCLPSHSQDIERSRSAQLASEESMHMPDGNGSMR